MQRTTLDQIPNDKTVKRLDVNSGRFPSVVTDLDFEGRIEFFQDLIFIISKDETEFHKATQIRTDSLREDGEDGRLIWDYASDFRSCNLVLKPFSFKEVRAELKSINSKIERSQLKMSEGQTDFRDASEARIFMSDIVVRLCRLAASDRLKREKD